MSKKNKIPFCPVCGKVDYVSILHKYFEKWKCTRCKIIFDFSSYPFDDFPLNTSISGTAKNLTIIDPAKINLGLARKAVGYPARTVLIDQNIGKIKLTSDIVSFKRLLASKDLLSLIPNSIGDNNVTQSGEIDLDNGTINPVEY